MNKANTLQIDFLKKLYSKIPANTLPANEIATLLHLSKSEAYNKLNGKSQLTVSQIYSICNKYDISFEISPANNHNNCRVRYTPFHTGNIDMGRYLLGLNKFMSELSKENNAKLSCATDDIPFFHLFKYPELTAFKLHFWESRITKGGMNNPEKIFDYKKVNKKDIKSAHQLHKTYSSIPCMEIWTKSYMLITPDQLRYAFESNLIKDNQLGKTICDQLLLTLDDIETYAIQKSKSNKTSVPFDWYQCDVVGNVSYLATTEHHQYCFLRFNTFNNLQSEDAQLCREVGMWLQSLLNNASGFSGHGSKQRNIYLRDARQTIENLKEMF